MRFLKSFLLASFIGAISVWFLNQYVVIKTKPYIHSSLSELLPPDNILVPGASVYRSGKLSPVLQERMILGIQAADSFPKAQFILSGHSISNGYNEPLAMQGFALQNKIEPERIYTDQKGVSTYMSLLNYKKNFPNSSLLIVSQRNHLHRAIYISQQIGIETYGFTSSTPSSFSIRETLSRIKDFFLLKFFRLFS